MESVTRNVTFPTTVRVDGSRVPDSGGTAAEQNSYSLEVTKAIVGDGFPDFSGLAPLLFLDPDAAEASDLWVLSIGEVELVLDDAAGTLVNTSAPQSVADGPRMTVASASIEINRLDPGGSGIPSTVEFRAEAIVLTPDETWTATDFTVGDWVTYDNGTTTNKYTCNTDTTAQQVPTNGSFWDDDGIVTFKNVFLMAKGYRQKVDQAPNEDDAANAAIVVPGGSFGDSSSNAYIVPSEGAAPYTQAGAAHVTTVTCVAGDDVGIAPGDYFTFDTPALNYYVYVEEDGGSGNDPAAAGRTGIEVDIDTVSPDTAVQVAAAMTAAINTAAAANVTADDTAADGTFTLTNTAVGGVPETVAVVGLANFAFEETVPGTDSSGDIFIDLASVLQAPTDTVDLVMGAFATRTDQVDELDYDILVADNTSTGSFVFRFIV